MVVGLWLLPPLDRGRLGLERRRWQGEGPYRVRPLVSGAAGGITHGVTEQWLMPFARRRPLALPSRQRPSARARRIMLRQESSNLASVLKRFTGARRVGQ